MIDDSILAIAVPAELKDGHPDSELVMGAIVEALRACENSKSVRVKSRMLDVHNALKERLVPLYKAHIQKEDEDWNALKEKASKLDSLPKIAVVTAVADRPFSKTFSAEADGNQWRIIAYPANEERTLWEVVDQNGEGADGPTPQDALRALLGKRGYAIAFG